MGPHGEMSQLPGIASPQRVTCSWGIQHPLPSITPTAACMTTDPGGEFCLSNNKPLEACNRITGLDGFPFFSPHPRVLGFRTETLESKEKIIVTLKNRQTMNTTKSVHALHKHTGALGIPTKHPRQKKLKASRRKAHQTAQGTASPLILFGKKKKIVKKKNQKGTQAALQFNGWVQGSELAGTARVALQEAHYGRVAFGPSDELLQGEFSISIGVHLAEDLFCSFLWG